jgi:hypothetical protein
VHSRISGENSCEKRFRYSYSSLTYSRNLKLKT